MAYQGNIPDHELHDHSFLDDERILRFDSVVVYISGKNSSRRIATPYSCLKRVKDVLCLDLNVQITN